MKSTGTTFYARIHLLGQLHRTDYLTECRRAHHGPWRPYARNPSYRSQTKGSTVIRLGVKESRVLSDAGRGRYLACGRRLGILIRCSILGGRLTDKVDASRSRRCLGGRLTLAGRHARGGSGEAAGASRPRSSLPRRAHIQRLGAGELEHVEQAGVEGASGGHQRPIRTG